MHFDLIHLMASPCSSENTMAVVVLARSEHYFRTTAEKTKNRLEYGFNFVGRNSYVTKRHKTKHLDPRTAILTNRDLVDIYIGRQD